MLKESIIKEYKIIDTTRYVSPSAVKWSKDVPIDHDIPFKTENYILRDADGKIIKMPAPETQLLLMNGDKIKIKTEWLAYKRIIKPIFTFLKLDNIKLTPFTKPFADYADIFAAVLFEKNYIQRGKRKIKVTLEEYQKENL